MTSCRFVRTQAEFDRVSHLENLCIHIEDGPVVVRSAASLVGVYDSAMVLVYGQATVVAHDTSTIEARGTSTVKARSRSTVRAYESAVVHAHYRAQVTAGPSVIVYRHSSDATISGGILARDAMEEGAEPREWCAFYGVPVAEDGTAVLIKAVNRELYSGYGTKYPIGETVTADDWDPIVECGYGLHLTATTLYSASYADDEDSSRFLACRVVVDGMVALGNKVKVRSCEVLYEVDRYGRPLTVAEATS